MTEYFSEICIGLMSLFGTLAGSYFSHKKSTALLAYRLEKLEEKVNKHNQIVERTYELEKHMAIVESELGVSIK